MDATCKIQDNIHVFSLAHKYVSRILGTYHAEYRKVSVFLLSKVSTVYPSLLKLFGFLLSRPYTYEEVVEYRYFRLL